jgi:hypothetical protein
MLRITEERLGETMVVHVAGRLVGQGVEELGRVCKGDAHGFQVELSGLLEADEVALSLLRSLRRGGAELVGLSPFMGLLLDPGEMRADR